ncbi:phosphotransferase [Mycolicibacterium fluoranthenivorans]|uniref:Aminoglycoside/choline kinase family phosphotransferase n=1 Tax=Mycolicibacterium fluoranthenivorans TaxID=258505 RepID=A0A7X5TXF2_9MYCO|nr:phosphotransferase [Mycolicibacterium fluoranthenivorans]MCV7359184.1 phosphotransferase [Mycolicibacterium fluoranthenivorans]NIH94534.1 aminoglycoside/choline kinase family phosphotransferase [Mycolicibacterium fluoranthenivorans]
MSISNADDLTPEWFTRVLGSSGAMVIDVHREQLSSGAMCGMTRAGLTWDTIGHEPASVIVKYPTADPGTRALAEAMRMYELEVQFYRDLAPHLAGVSIPTCYFSELNHTTSAFTLVLEDLRGKTRPGDVLTESTADECAAVLDQLAHLQGASWNLSAAAAMPWLADRNRTYTVFDSMPAGLQPWLDRFGHALEPEQVALFETVIPQAGRWIRSWNGPSVVQHGDLRTDNILFSLDPVPRATIVDFQTVRLGPPGIDPAYFLGSSLSTQNRRAYELDLLKEFHRHLVAVGAADYDFNACLRDYREGAIYAVFLFCGLSSQIPPSERFDRVIADQTRRYADMALDLNSARLANLM